MSAPPGALMGIFAGRYKIERVIGQGATATVHLARDTQLGRAVALKILREELVQSAASARFLREIRRTSALKHPHILEVLGSGEHEGRLYFALPYMEGGTLRTLLKREKGLPLNRIVEIARPIAEALDYAHKRALVHRDVKPENILFTSGKACLGDFGIARALELSGGETGSTSANTVRGTPAYMSPEQAAASPDIDGRSDVYSLACVLYEMVTGMQAFIGPTPESIINQRFQFPPREVRVFRPTAPIEVDTVLAKAFAITPADRYQTATDLVDAFARAITSPIRTPIVEPRRTPPGSVAPSRKWRLIGAAIGIAVVAVATTIMVPRIGRPPGPAVLDDTLIVLLPLERDAPSTQPWRDDDLLQQGLARWRGIGVVDQFQIADALRRVGPINTSEKANAVATFVGAGRYIRGSISALGDSWRVAASLYDAASGKPLYQAAERVPTDIAGATVAYARLADSLLLRGATADSVPVAAAGTRSLPAVQAFARGLRALDDWDLEAADSLFQAAVIHDVDYARANLWLAQVRAWRGLPRNSWGTVAERASAMFPQLNARERRLTTALVLLSRGSFEQACAAYDTLARRNNKDFAAWFGLGQCRTANRLVYRDPRSPSGYSFRSSTHRAMQAYERAFEILPSVHRGYERGAFSQLRLTLRTTSFVSIGYGATDSARFYARPGWVGDTLALIPYPWQAVSAGDARTVPPNFAQALAKRREAFKRIASNWSAAFPTSAGAKYAVAIALETLSDPAAIDTLRLARSLTTDPSQRTQLAAYEVLLLAKFGLPDRLDMLMHAAALADSLLASAHPLGATDADLLTQVAMLVGACDAAERFARATPQDPGPQAIKTELYVESQELLARAGSGCHTNESRVTAFAQALDRELRGKTEDDRGRMLETWLSRLLLLSRDAHVSALRLLAAHSSDEFVQAALTYARRDLDSTKSLLRVKVKPTGDTLTPPTPDVSYPKARLAVAIGDTVAATERLDRTLNSIRSYDPIVLSTLMRTGPLMRCVVLRAEIAIAVGDTALARKWSTAAVVLLSHGDLDLKVDLQKLKPYSSAAKS